MATNPTRFVGLGTLPMNAPTLAVEEIKRAVRDLKFPGFQIGSHIGDWNLDAKELYPVYKVSQPPPSPLTERLSGVLDL